MAVNPSLLLQSDEADTLLTAMRGDGGHASKMNEMILRTFLRKLKVDAITFKKLILTMGMSSLIESEQQEYNKIVYSLMRN